MIGFFFFFEETQPFYFPPKKEDEGGEVPYLNYSSLLLFKTDF